MKTEKAIKLKTGDTLPQGLPVSFIQDNSTVCLVHGDARDYRVRITSAFKAPDLEELQEAVSDGICPSIGGDSVEPDGWGSEGDPSWLMALGMI